MNNKEKLNVVRPIHIKLYKFIKNFVHKNGYAPLYEDVEGKIKGIGCMSTYYRTLKDLEKMGCVVRIPGKFGIVGTTDVEPHNNLLNNS